MGRRRAAACAYSCVRAPCTAAGRSVSMDVEDTGVDRPEMQLPVCANVCELGW